MKKILAPILISTSLLAGNVGLTSFGLSHHKSDNRNENHNYIGIKYTYPLEESLSYTMEIATFKNSYSDRTYTYTMGASWLPLEYHKVKFGGNLSLGGQKGYCMDGLMKTKECTDDKDVSMLFLPSLEIKYPLDEYRNIGVNVTYTGNVFARFYFDLVSW